MMEDIQKVLAKYWGYDDFLPLQKQAMECICRGCDSVVVLPTGGGKSLCFQAPALAMNGMAVVVSPLISLMKDQVDALKLSGIQAACLNSNISSQEQSHIKQQALSGELKLLYLAPERMFVNDMRFLDFFKNLFSFWEL